MPLITFLAATSFSTSRSSKRTLILTGFILILIFLSIAMQVSFEAYDSNEVKDVSPFFNRIEETLATYLMLILGLEVAASQSEAPAAGGGATVPAAPKASRDQI
jgi:hypothetical protein